MSEGKADVTVCSQALHHTKEAIDAFEKGLSIDGDNAALHAGIMQAIADACAWHKKERYLPKVLSSMQREVQAALQHGAPRLLHPPRPGLSLQTTCLCRCRAHLASPSSHNGACGCPRCDFVFGDGLRNPIG